MDNALTVSRIKKIFQDPFSINHFIQTIFPYRDNFNMRIRLGEKIVGGVRMAFFSPSNTFL